MQELSQLPDGVSCFINSLTPPPPPWSLLQGRLQVLDELELRISQEEIQEIFRESDHQSCLDGRVAVAALMRVCPDLRRLMVQSENPQELLSSCLNEIWQTLDGGSQNLLMQSALLPCLSAQGLERLTGKQKALELVQMLYRQNILTAGLSEGEFSYHSILRDFLLFQLRESRSHAERKNLYEKVAGVLLEQGLIEEAMELLKKAQAWKQVATLACDQASVLITQGRNHLLDSWLSPIPPTVSNPRLSYWQGNSCLFQSPREARAYFIHAFTGFGQQGKVVDQLLAWTGIIDSFYCEQGDFHQADPWIDRLKPLLTKSFPSVEVKAQVTHAMLVALLYRQPRNPDLNRWFEYGLDMLQKPIGHWRRLNLASVLLGYCTWMGHGTRMKSIVDSLAEPPEKNLPGSNRALLQTFLECQQDWYQGNYSVATARCIEVLETMPVIPVMQMELAWVGISAALNQGDGATASRLLRWLNQHVDCTRFTQAIRYYYLSAWCALHEQQPQQSLEQAGLALDYATRTGVPCFRLWLIWCLLMFI